MNNQAYDQPRAEQARIDHLQAKLPQWADPWRHRSDGMRCKTCMWFNPKHPQAQTDDPESRRYDVGRCRRHAPSMGGYPVVFVNDWCGDHRLDENKV